jgi:hypothetical protein
VQPPFSAEQFLDAFRLYNLSVWPMQLVLVGIGFVVVVLALTSARASPIVALGLAALWAWTGLGYHLDIFTKLTPAAYLFAAVSLVEAMLLAWHGLWTRRLHFAPPQQVPALLVGALLVAFAVVGYPAVAHLLGQRPPVMPTFGLPCPTVIFTLGLLTWAAPVVPRSLLVVPVAWALVGSSVAVSLGVGEDFALIPATVLALGAMLWCGRRKPSVGSSAAAISAAPAPSA